MKRGLFFILALVFLVSGCHRNNTVKTSGTVTIDNTLYGTTVYYALGFTFSLDEKVSTLRNPGPDITADNDGTIGNVRLLTNNFSDSFYKAGAYSSASEAETAFRNLTAPVVSQWAGWADSVKPNQIWVFKTGDEFYAKMRIVSVDSRAKDSRNFAGCTFDWVYQPDGSLTFPAK
jgi:hypothetical protein